MPVYRAKIEGAKPLLIRAESAAKAKDQIVELESLTSEQMADALEAGEKIHRAGDPIVLVAQDKATAPAKEDTQQGDNDAGEAPKK